MPVRGPWEKVGFCRGCNRRRNVDVSAVRPGYTATAASACRECGDEHLDVRIARRVGLLFNRHWEVKP